VRTVAEVEGRIETGELECIACHSLYPIERFIPRFVSNDPQNYSAGFGFQWNKHYQTQYDRYSGANVSEERYFKETRWGRNLSGQRVLEAGSGSGRFTEHAASTGAMVISFDYSNAVEANYRSNGLLDNLLIVQASIYEMPFVENYFDKIFCIGVIQHTPNPEAAFHCLVAGLKPGGNIVIDAYRIFPWWKQALLTKYWVRPITKRVPTPLLYRFCERWVNAWWGVTGVFWKLTGRRALSWFLLIADYRGKYPLSDKIQKEWAILDAFDMLSPAYDYPQTIRTVSSWFHNASLAQVEVGYGYNGIEGRGSKT
jgi:SAM-dependent methyltransferase